MIKSTVFPLFFLLIFYAGYAQKRAITWVSTTENESFLEEKPLSDNGPSDHVDVEILTENPLQTINGFGGCFNELGWTSLKVLNESDRQNVLEELFGGAGAGFNICRMPIGANDFSLKWYSYDETEGDFLMKNFSIKNDLQTLVPYIKSAKKYNPDLKIWASPWSPPQWMKYNKHYAQSMFEPGSPYTNGLKPEQVGKPGTNMFIQDEKYFKAYALYFERFIKAYRQQGIQIAMVMPQNEFVSAQVFPSCTWHPSALGRFIKHLGPQMKHIGVEVYYGTVNNGDQRLVDTVLTDPDVNKFIKGVGLQWGGKDAVAGIHKTYPDLTIYQTEHECGDGRNDWSYCRYSWDLMKHYLSNGANAYIYWNISLPKGGISTWGWRQNSLISVDTVSGTFVYNHEYYLMKHFSHYVKAGAKLLPLKGEFNNMLAFINSDRTVVMVVQNESKSERELTIKINNKIYKPLLRADSFNTLVVPGS